VQDNRDKTLAQQPESLAARIKAAQDDALVMKATAQAYGLNEVKVDTGGHKGESEAPSVVSAAMTHMDSMIKETNEMSKEKEKELLQARKEADDARASLFTTQLQVIQNMQDSLMESQKRMSEQNSPEAAISTVEKWETIFNKFRPQVSNEPSAALAKGTSDQTTITLEKMRQDHDREMKQIDLQITTLNNDFQLRMLQFNEDSRRRWKEYEDGNKLKENAFGGFSDLAASIAAGIDKERGVGTAAPEESIQAAVSGFKCQLCGTHVDIPEGVERVVCSKPGCGAEYAIKVKG